MSEFQRLMYAESVSSSTVVLERHPNDVGTVGGTGIRSVTVITEEATAIAGFWGTTGSCGLYEVIIRKMQ